MNRITLFRTIPRIVMGPGALNQLADEVRALKANKVLNISVSISFPMPVCRPA
jgi:hypothetical protein